MNNYDRLTREELEKEVARLKSGDFTEEEFQNLCHKFSDSDKTSFCNGCESYQAKLFGQSPITELKTKIKELEEQVEQRDVLIKSYDRLMT
jgi:hypothetical protein